MMKYLLLACFFLGLAAAQEQGADPNPCPTDNDIGCWTCLNAASEEDCALTGEYRQCHQSDPVCEHEIHQNDNGEVSQVTRKCKERIACEVRHANGSGICGKLEHNRLCRECNFGNGTYRCLPPPEEPLPCQANDGQRMGCWTCHNEPSEEACTANGELRLCHMHDPVCEYNYHQNDNGGVIQVTRMCKERMACEVRAANGSGICGKLQHNRICRECTLGESVSEPAAACVEPEVDPCADVANGTLHCWTCHNAVDEAECRATGQMRMCHMSDPVCEYETHVNFNGGVSQVTRMCKQRRACNVRRDSPSGICYKLAHNQICRSCEGGDPGQDYECSAPEPEPYPCGAASGEGLWCLSCQHAETDEACLDAEMYEYCGDNVDNICEYSELDNGGGLKVSRGCKKVNACSGNSPGKMCDYGEDGIHHVCAPPPTTTAAPTAAPTTAAPTTAAPTEPPTTTIPPPPNPTTAAYRPNPTTAAYQGPCDVSAGEELACWTCKNAGSEEECMSDGSYEVCHMREPTCEYEVHENLNGGVFQITRGCKEIEACENHEEDNAAVCDKNVHNTLCRNCTLGNWGEHFKCVEPPPAGNPCTDEPMEHLACWTCMNEDSVEDCMNNGHYTVCRQSDPICEFDTHYKNDGSLQITRRCKQVDACEVRAAMNTPDCDDGGTPYANSHCRQCTYGYVGVDSLCIPDSGEPPEEESPCDGCVDDVLACWGCNAGSDEECWATGGYETCRMSDPVCEYEKHINENGDVSQVRRGCRQRVACENRANDQASRICDALPHNSLCRECSYGIGNKDFICVHEVDDEEQESPCDADGDQILACWTCHNAASEAECFELGSYKACHMSDPMCLYEIHENTHGDVFQVTRMCKQRQACENLAADKGEVCTKHAHNTLCRECTFGDDALCVDEDCPDDQIGI